jgi:serine/threonine-protein kinase
VINQRLAHYEISSRLGAGGMGEVYRATDTKLGREVAIKVLPELFASDPDRVVRFEREAKLLASLNHPNIAAIYGLEQSGGVLFLVLELVEGETLADRIAHGPIPAAEALQIARQVVEALEAAHEKGVIHRDLKPANIKITPDGKVKVLDFGLAKAFAVEQANAQLSQSPTISTAATGAGIILGTAAYMSPEQAKGNLQVDKRSDIFSFGCVLYDMLAGRQAFQGETVTEVLASVLAREADLTRLPANLNPKVYDLLRRSLEKDLKKRWQAVGDLRVEIESVLADPRGVEIKAPALAPPWARWKVAAAVLASAVIGAAIAGAAVWSLRPSAVPAKVTRFPFVLPEDQTFTRTGRHLLAISPDGMSVVYVANNQLYLRRMAEMEARPIPGTDQDVNSPFFSPDGQWVGFYSFQDSTLKKIAITGGAAVTLCAATNPFGVSWDGDSIIFGQGANGILVVAANGGKPEVWARPESGEVASSPQILPGGNAALFTVTKAGNADRWDKANIVVQSRNSGERKVVIQGGGAARYVPTGHIVYALGTNLLALPFDVKRLEVTGGPIPIVEGIARALNPETNTAAAHVDFSTDGTLAYIPSSSLTTGIGQRVLILTDRGGKNEALGLPAGVYDYPRFSPDGKQLAVQTNDDSGGAISIYDLSGKSSLRRLTFQGNSRGSVWSRDGRRVAFGSSQQGKPGIFWQAADGTGVAERLTTAAAGEDVHLPTSWSPDGNTLVFEIPKNGDWGLWALSAKGERKAEPLVDLPGSLQRNAEFSPDGRWFAYLSNEAKSEQVYVQPFPPTGAKYQISREHSHAPVWSPNGKELFYYDVDARKLVAVTIQTQPSFSFGVPVPLPFEGMLQQGFERQYDVSPDGKRFLVLLPATPDERESRPTQQINIVLNWFEELKQRVPTR